MREELNKILSNVNDWLKFAETKNAGLVVFNSAAIAGILQAYPNEPSQLLVFKGIIIAFLAVSTCICLYTFLPVLSRTFKYQKFEQAQYEAEKQKLNCYFFNHHSKINCNQLIDLLKSKLGSTNGVHTDIETDIADQIINNAEIAVSKFRLFSWAAYLTFAAVVTGLVVIFLKLFF